MKVAIVYDGFLECGGAEKSILITAKELKADIFTTIVKKVDEKLIDGLNFYSWNHLTFPNHKILTFTEVAFRLKNFIEYFEEQLKNKYDVFLISGIYGISASFIHPNCFLCFTPPRALYTHEKIIENKLDFFRRQAFKLWVHLYKKYDMQWATDVDRFIAISDEVHNRIKEYYNRESYISYLPVDTEKYRYKDSKDYWFCPNRLYPEKRVDMVVEAFKRLPNEKLIISGDGSEREKIKQMIRGWKNIKYIGNMNSDQMIELYSNCKGTICFAENEDLGLIPIESMASGKPIIVPNDGGGLLESVINNKTGWYVYPSAKSLAYKINQLNLNDDLRKMKNDCIKRAKFFDTKNYIKKIKDNLKSAILSKSSL